jgi:glycerol-3-phosphate acyltransferase PlsX
MKAVEGCGKTVSTILKREYKRNLWTKICALFSSGIIKNIRGSLDYESKGGAMFLGLNKAVVKGHGNSKARAFEVCISQAANAVRGDMVGKMKTMIDAVNIDALAKPAETAVDNSAQP